MRRWQVGEALRASAVAEARLLLLEPRQKVPALLLLLLHRQRGPLLLRGRPQQGRLQVELLHLLVDQVDQLLAVEVGHFALSHQALHHVLLQHQVDARGAQRLRRRDDARVDGRLLELGHLRMHPPQLLLPDRAEPQVNVPLAPEVGLVVLPLAQPLDAQVLGEAAVLGRDVVASFVKLVERIGERELVEAVGVERVVHVVLRLAPRKRHLVIKHHDVEVQLQLALGAKRNGRLRLELDGGEEVEHVGLTADAVGVVQPLDDLLGDLQVKRDELGVAGALVCLRLHHREHRLQRLEGDLAHLAALELLEVARALQVDRLAPRGRLHVLDLVRGHVGSIDRVLLD
mmetsp:Transcript_21508/g.45416  ORF Transcript_21508/g.45416 Transcript_21508/m.45416 type:complete len:344 (+) Transcript_21508:983-2014(+)